MPGIYFIPSKANLFVGFSAREVTKQRLAISILFNLAYAIPLIAYASSHSSGSNSIAFSKHSIAILLLAIQNIVFPLLNHV